MKNTNNGKFDIEKWFEGRTVFMITIGGVLISTFIFVYKPISDIQTNIALIKQDTAQIRKDMDNHITGSMLIDKDVGEKLVQTDKEISLIKQYLHIK